MKLFRLLYLIFLRLFRPLVKRLYPSANNSNQRLNPDLMKAIRACGENLFWFHGSSLGELEILIPVIESLLRKDKTAKIIVTALSNSTIRKLDSILKMDRVVAARLCPIEGQWAECFHIHKPKAFITAKYDLFPELLIALCEMQIHTVVVCARSRPSLKTVNRMLKGFSLNADRIQWVAENSADQEGLSLYYNKSQIHRIPNPRWDQIQNRINHADSNVRFNTLKSAIHRLPLFTGRKVGFIAQVYQNDSTFIDGVISKISSDELIFLVPHELDQKSVMELTDLIGRLKVPFIRTSTVKGASIPNDTLVLLVDEIGILTELYTLGHVTYVGGGFGPKGIHSVAEPACAGHQVLSGTMNVDRFPEVEFLKSLGLLHISKDQAELADQFLSMLREHKRTDNGKIPFGGSEKTADFILNLR